MEDFGDLADFDGGKKVTVHRSFAEAGSTGWAAVRHYIADHEVTKREYHDLFSEVAGGTWDPRDHP